MPHVASAIYPTYALPSQEWCFTVGEASPWLLEEPCLKRPRLGSYSHLASVVPTPLRALSPHRWLDSFGQLPPKRPRCREEVRWPAMRGCEGSTEAPTEHGAIALAAGERGGAVPRQHAEPSTFKWGELPLRPMEVVPTSEAAAQASPFAPSDGEVAMADAPGTLEPASSAGQQLACTALVPYSLAAAVRRRSGAALHIQSELRISTTALALREQVQVHEVVVDARDELQAVVVYESQVPLAVLRLGTCLRPLHAYETAGPGLYVVPLRPPPRVMAEDVGRPGPPTPRPRASDIRFAMEMC